MNRRKFLSLAFLPAAIPLSAAAKYLPNFNKKIDGNVVHITGTTVISWDLGKDPSDYVIVQFDSGARVMKTLYNKGQTIKFPVYK